MEGKSFELVYFPFRGRAEVIRLCLAASEIAYTETEVGIEAMVAVREAKSGMLKSMQYVPILKVHDSNGGETFELPQSYAIIRFIAKMGNNPLLPQDAFDAARADMIAETHLDWRLREFNPVAFRPGFLSDRAAVQNYFDNQLPPILDTFDSLLGDSQLFAGERLTYADLAVWDSLDRHMELAPTTLHGHPRLAAFYARIKAVPKIEAYLQRRRPLEPFFEKFVNTGTVQPKWAQPPTPTPPPMAPPVPTPTAPHAASPPRAAPKPLVRQNSALAAKVSAKLEKRANNVDRSRAASAADAEPAAEEAREPSAAIAAANDPQSTEAEARVWIEAILGETLDGTLHEALRSGVVLCRLLDAIKPGCCKAPSKMAAPFKQMENIGNYLSACSTLGQRPQESFQTVDLYEGRNMGAVVIQLHSLGRLCQASLDFEGPKLGVKVAEKNHRTFTEAQLREAAASSTFLGKGSHGTIGGDMSKAHVGKVYDRANVAGNEGLGTGGEATLVGKGAQGTIGGNMSKAHVGKVYDRANVAGNEGLGTGGEATLVGKGAHGTMGGSMSRLDHGKQIDKTAKVDGIDGLGTGG